MIKRLFLLVLILMGCFNLRAANPSFSDFDTAIFRVTGNKVGLVSSNLLSVPNAVGALTNDGVGNWGIFDLSGIGGGTGTGMSTNGGSGTNNIFSRAVLTNAVTVHGGLTNSALTASTILEADINKQITSIPNGTGALTNNGAGTFGWFDLALLSGTGTAGSNSPHMSLTAAASAGDPDIRVSYLDTGLSSGAGYLVIDPYSTNCELRQVALSVGSATFTNYTFTITSVPTSGTNITLSGTPRYWGSVSNGTTILTNLIDVNYSATNIYNQLKQNPQLSSSIVVWLSANSMRIGGDGLTLSASPAGWYTITTNSGVANTIIVRGNASQVPLLYSHTNGTTVYWNEGALVPWNWFGAKYYDTSAAQAYANKLGWNRLVTNLTVLKGTVGQGGIFVPGGFWYVDGELWLDQAMVVKGSGTDVTGIHANSTFSGADDSGEVALLHGKRGDTACSFANGGPLSRYYISDIHFGCDNIPNLNGMLISLQQPSKFEGLRIDSARGKYGLCISSAQDSIFNRLQFLNCSTSLWLRGCSFLTFNKCNIEQTFPGPDIFSDYAPSILGGTFHNTFNELHLEESANRPVAIDLQGNDWIFNGGWISNQPTNATVFRLHNISNLGDSSWAGAGPVSEIKNFRITQTSDYKYYYLTLNSVPGSGSNIVVNGATRYWGESNYYTLILTNPAASVNYAATNLFNDFTTYPSSGVSIQWIAANKVRFGGESLTVTFDPGYATGLSSNAPYIAYEDDGRGYTQTVSQLNRGYLNIMGAAAGYVGTNPPIHILGLHGDETRLGVPRDGTGGEALFINIHDVITNAPENNPRFYTFANGDNELMKADTNGMYIKTVLTNMFLRLDENYLVTTGKLGANLSIAADGTMSAVAAAPDLTLAIQTTVTNNTHNTVTGTNDYVLLTLKSAAGGIKHQLEVLNSVGDPILVTTPGGRVGIGTTGPGFDFDVNGNFNSIGYYQLGEQVMSKSGGYLDLAGGYGADPGSVRAQRLKVDITTASSSGIVVNEAIGQSVSLFKVVNTNAANIFAITQTNTIAMLDTNNSTITKIWTQSGTIYSGASPPNQMVRVSAWWWFRFAVWVLILVVGVLSYYVVRLNRRVNRLEQIISKLEVKQ